MIKKLVIKALGVVAIIFCLFSWLFQIEKIHYLFENPGINSDATEGIMIFSALAFLSSSCLLLFRHSKKTDFILPYIINVLSIIRLCQIVEIYQKYEFLWG